MEHKLEPLKTRLFTRCTRCIMDMSAKNITFDDQGVCNYCTEFLLRLGPVINQDPLKRKKDFDAIISKIKFDGRSKSYDCIVGVSGGVDSSWVLVQVVQAGLKPLAVHMDNGWNSELAQNNIANLVKTLKVDLYTYVINWNEYRGLMHAFFDADVIDIELLYDNALLAVNYRQANKYGIKYILSGSNLASEGMRMPPEWNWFKYDQKNIVAIAKKFGAPKIRTFPLFSVLNYVFYEHVKKIRWVPFLDYTNYNKESALKELEANFGYKRYPYKHYESIFTRFYQGYILPNKFKVDKRLLHFSTLVVSGQLRRETALTNLKSIPYPSARDLEDDISYFLKKMGWTRAQLDNYITRPGIMHSIFPSEAGRLELIISYVNKFLPDFLRRRIG